MALRVRILCTAKKRYAGQTRTRLSYRENGVGMDQELEHIQQLLREQLYDQAIPRITAYVAAHPDNPAGHNIRGMLLRELGHPTESIEALTTAIGLGPGFRSNLGMSRLHLKQWKFGWADYEY